MRLILIGVLLVMGCGRSSPAPTPTPVAPGITTPPAAGVVEISGRVVATVTGEPLAGVTLALGSVTGVTNAAGAFALSWDTRAGRAGLLMLGGPGILARALTIGTQESRQVTVDAIALGGGFDLDYYRRLVRNTSDAPGTLRALQRWTRAPRVYLKTIDESGWPVDEATLQATESALLDDPTAWTGGRFGLLDVVRGPESREGQSGWITVKWPNPTNEGGNCGRAQVGLEGGWIELNYLNPNCACGASRIGAGIVRHELGHALGFFHTGEPSDLLRTTLDIQTLCQGQASARERFHAAIAYSRPNGNTDPDHDPTSTLQRRQSEPVVIVD